MIRPSTWSGVIGASLALVYALIAIQLPAGSGRAVVGFSALAIVLAVVGSELWAWSFLEPLRAIELHKGALQKEHLSSAVRRVRATPDGMFWAAVCCWVGGLTLVGLGSKVTAGLSWTVAGRLIWVGVLIGPLAALLSYFLTALQARKVMKQVCELGLSADDMIVAAPPKRAQLRARLVIFTAICVICPAALTADLASTFARRGFEAVAAVSSSESPDGQRALAAELRSEAVTRVAVMSGLVFILAVAIAYVGGTALSQPMRDVAEEATRIAKGELRGGRPIPAEDEIWAVSAAFSSMQVHLTRVLSELKRAGVHIGTTTEQIVGTSGRYESGAAEQATALNETSATTEELARSARQIAESATQVAEMAQKTLNAAQAGQLSADAFSESMGRMKQDNQSIADSVLKLNKRVQQIGRIVEFINGVADKSDLLALNAELEGTKAGEVGRGFSLVAAEMRRLAENVIESTKEIEGLIEEIREATGAAVTATEAGVKATDSGGTLASQVLGSLKEIVELAGQTSDAVRSISLATQQQQTGTDQLAEAMADILRVTQQSLAATKQVTTANVDLSQLAGDLKQAVERFQIGEG